MPSIHFTSNYQNELILSILYTYGPRPNSFFKVKIKLSKQQIIENIIYIILKINGGSHIILEKTEMGGGAFIKGDPPLKTIFFNFEKQELSKTTDYRLSNARDCI